MDSLKELIRAYSQTRYIVDTGHGEITARIGERSDDIERLLEQAGATTAVMITAWNPFSQPTPDLENRSANLRLAGELERCCASVLSGRGAGDDGTWPPEDSFLGIGLDRAKAEALGRKYRQHAIVWFEYGRPAELLMLDASQNA